MEYQKWELQYCLPEAVELSIKYNSLAEAYSDHYKAIFGVRPRLPVGVAIGFNSVAALEQGYQAMLKKVGELVAYEF